MNEDLQAKTYEEVLALKDLFLRRLMDDKVKNAAIAQLRDNYESIQKQLNEKAIVSLVNDIVLVCDRIDAQENVDELSNSIEDELLEVLSRREFYRMPDSNCFDPQYHNAIGTVEANEDCPEKSIFKVVRSGYFFRDKVFRPADVIVAVKKAKAE